MKSKVISPKWMHYITAKHYYFAAAAQYQQACHCLKQRKYGEAVTWLQDSLVCANEVLKEARYINETVLSKLNGLKIKLQEELERAERDNDAIHLRKPLRCFPKCLLLMMNYR
jgi:programmed cell death 6-interacting protein